MPIKFSRSLRRPDLALPGAPGRSLWRGHGVMAIIGPYNYPIHLMHTHVAPALLAGNTVIIKPSQVTPLAGQIYTEIMAELELPAGVFNLVQGRGSAVGVIQRPPQRAPFHLPSMPLWFRGP